MSISMDCEVNEGPMQDSACAGMEEHTDDAAFEDEKCGICMDVIIDRGVLDSCNHWFCFACIDNWATVTNFCPLCKTEFQSITCIPVYDTIGSLKGEECTVSREDDWCVQGKNNTLSFPSYYIDEDAVACLGDDGCRVRNGYLTAEDGEALDTSIACDSCDVWYHAFCVGFDPDSSYESSWLCPRCNVNKLLDQTDATLDQNLSKNCGVEVISSLLPTQTNLSGKLTVSAADSGETAVVVSLVERKQFMYDEAKNTSKILSDPEGTNPETLPTALITDDHGESMSEPDLHFLESSCCNDPSTSGMVLPHSPRSQNDFSCGMQDSTDMPSHGATCGTTFHVSTDSHGIPLSLSLFEDASVSSSDDLKCSAHYQTNYKPSIDKKGKTLDPVTCEKSHFQDSELPAKEPNIDLSLGLMLQTCSSVQDKITNQKENAFEESSQVTSDDACPDKKSVKVEARNIVIENDQTEHHEKFKETERGASHKRRMRPESNFEMIPSKREDNVSASGSTSSCSKQVNHSNIKKRKAPCVKEGSTFDIIDLVKEVDRDNPHEFAAPVRGARATKHRENAAGVRIKKIMKRSVDDNESSQIVQKIKKEIGDTITDEALKSSEKSDLVDLKLLNAFRAAITGSDKEHNRKGISSLAKSKKLLLQKGKIRENLTRKLYGTASGRRHRAWDRDWEIEFWKHRCLHTKAQKVETLQSVLELLRKNDESLSEELKDEEKFEGEDMNPILSRLYLADASLLPRDENIKPLSALSGSDENEKEKVRSVNISKPSQVTSASNNFEQISATLPGAPGNTPPKCKLGVSSKKLHADGQAHRLKTLSVTSYQGTPIKKEVQVTAEDMKADKKKWALAVLARKTADTDKDKNEDKQEEARLQGNYPLLAQLPPDMRPIVAPSCHSKIPMSVRQVQLNRLTENYLKKAGLTVICRSAATELAVADALNVEKQICERSKSKIVYLNLCSQALSQHVTASDRLNEAADTIPDAPSKVVEGGQKETFSDNGLESVEHALRQAGLLSDSPPNSPYRQLEGTNKNYDPASASAKNVCENVLDIDSVPVVDIYGDFDYDLDEDGIGLSAINCSFPETSVDVTDSKMKVVLHTLHCEEPVNTGFVATETRLGSESEKLGKRLLDSDSLDQEDLVNWGGNRDSPKLAETCENKIASNSILNVRSDDPNEISTGLSRSEYEELYGKDEDHLQEKVFGKEPSNYQYECTENQAASEKVAREENGKHMLANIRLMSHIESECCAENNVVEFGGPDNGSCSKDNSPTRSLLNENAPMHNSRSNQKQTNPNPIYGKVEAYIKEHIRPLCKSGVITVEQYRWAVTKTADKVMQYHFKEKNADFLIKEGHKVRNLAEQYVESSKKRFSRPSSSHAK